MNHKNVIGSRAAAKLAQNELGPRAFVERQGKMFFVCKGYRFGRLQVSYIMGQDKSWELALTAAGVEIPASAILSTKVPTLGEFAEALYAESRPDDETRKVTEVEPELVVAEDFFAQEGEK